MTDMSKTPAEGLSHYTMVCGLNSNKLKDVVLGHQNAYWITMKGCFGDICTFNAGYDRVDAKKSRSFQ